MSSMHRSLLIVGDIIDNNEFLGLKLVYDLIEDGGKFLRALSTLKELKSRIWCCMCRVESYVAFALVMPLYAL